MSAWCLSIHKINISFSLMTHTCPPWPVTDNAYSGNMVLIVLPEGGKILYSCGQVSHHNSQLRLVIIVLEDVTVIACHSCPEVLTNGQREARRCI